MLDVMKAPMGKEEEELEGDDEFGMSLELSIGGSYGKTDGNSKGETCEREAGGGEYYKSEENGSSSCFAGSEENCSVISAMDLQRRRETQALRRQEARKKREEKLLLKNSRGLGFVVDDNCKLLLSLEAQQVQARAVDRDQGFSEERARKKDKISDLNHSLCSGEDDDKKIEGRSECLYPQLQQFVAGCGNGSFGCPWPWKGNVGCSSLGGSTSVDYSDDSEQNNGGTVNVRGNLNAGSNGSLEQCSSAVSDYQSTSHKGGSTSDVGSNSHLEGNGSSSPTQLDNKVAPLSISQSSRTTLPLESKTGSYPDQIANSNSPATKNRASPPSKEMNDGGGGPIDQPPKPPNQNMKAASSVPHMPCVTTTGNGPNGRTVTGFLYKYSKTEVSIMCVCHGSSFSPAEFVEHAGGVDVSNPLRHITVVPSPMAFR